MSDCEIFALRKYLGSVSEVEDNWAKLLTPMSVERINKYGLYCPPLDSDKLLNKL